MGSLNTAPTYVSLMTKLQRECDTLAKECGLKKLAPKIIVDDVLLYGRTVEHLLEYFIKVLDVLKHHHTTLKLIKLKCFQERCKFVWMGMTAGET